MSRPGRSVMMAVVCTVLFSASALAQAPGPDLEKIISDLERAQAENRSRTPPYTVLREYKLVDGEGEDSPGVTAEVSFLPPTTKQFAIRSGEGQAKKIVGRVLKSETELARQPASTEISRRNYEFRFLRRARLNGADCFVLGLTPKREDKNLVEGKIWVDANTSLIHRVEGRLVRNPSWWVRHVNVTLTYGRAGDFWLLTSTHAAAEVRFFGRHTLTSRSLQVRSSQRSAHSQRPGAVPAGAILLRR